MDGDGFAHATIVGAVVGMERERHAVNDRARRYRREVEPDQPASAVVSAVVADVEEGTSTVGVAGLIGVDGRILGRAEADRVGRGGPGQQTEHDEDDCRKGGGVAETGHQETPGIRALASTGVHTVNPKGRSRWFHATR